MNLFELTRALVDIESTTNREENVADFLFAQLSILASRTSGRLERMAVEPNRDNIFVCWGEPVVTLSTHMDTVPPFFPSLEDADFIWGRGSCDAKGIIAAMIVAAEKLLKSGATNFGLLFVVGEERNSAGAKVAAANPRGSRFLINGEPTENQLALGSKGALRFEVTAHGKLAHSAYPELGHSAIHSLLDVLRLIRRIPLPEDPLLGPCTLNIGTIAGGRAPNVIADAAKAEIMVRLVGDAAPIREAYVRAVGSRAELVEILSLPPIRFASVDGMPTTVVSFTTDVPVFGKTWGEPLLLGPGSIHVAHTSEERISKRELSDAVEMYANVVKKLMAKA